MSRASRTCAAAPHIHVTGGTEGTRRERWMKFPGLNGHSKASYPSTFMSSVQTEVTTSPSRPSVLVRPPITELRHWNAFVCLSPQMKLGASYGAWCHKHLMKQKFSQVLLFSLISSIHWDTRGLSLKRAWAAAALSGPLVQHEKGIYRKADSPMKACIVACLHKKLLYCYTVNTSFK